MLGLLSFLLSIANTVIKGMVFVCLYDWFLVTNYQLPHINLASAIGIGLAISLTTSQFTYADAAAIKSDSKEEAQIVNLTVQIVLFSFSVIVLAIGFIAHSFV